MSTEYQFHYKISGDRTKPVVLFLHGFMGNSSCFDEAISRLANDFCCLAVDLPGHGATNVLGDDECYTITHTASGIIDLLDQLHVNTCALVGYSMGGRLALYLAIRFSQRFSKLVLESASPGIKTSEEQLKRLQHDLHLAHLLETTEFSLFLSNWYTQPIFDVTQNHPNFHNLFQRRLQNNPFGLAKSLRHMSTGFQPSLWNDIQHNTIPLLLLVGQYDEKFKQINAEMASLCKVAQLEVIAGCGHTIHFENPDAFVKSISRFLLPGKALGMKIK